MNGPRAGSRHMIARVALDLDPKNAHALLVLEELEKEQVEAGKGK